MKNQIVFTILFFITAILTAEDVQLRKIAQFQNDPNNNETISIRSDVGDDDISGNTMLISSEGKILIHCRDKNEVFYFDSRDKKLHPLFNTNFLPAPNFAYFNQITKSHYFFFGNNGNFYLVDKDFNLTANINFLYNWDVRTYFDAALYDEDSDTLFFLDNDKDIHSIEHPSLDENINQKNYRDSSETMTRIGNDEYAPHLTIDKKRKLYIDGVIFAKGYYDYEFYEINDYKVSLINEDYHINVYDGNKRQFLYYTIPENEKIESITYHPNGDWYFLTINWTTNMHTLWRIENTWDTKWREQWNKEHETGKVTVNKILTCNDNLRLRSEEATSSKIITTMSKGTKVKILKLGKAETIDGINSNWVQIEVLSGAKDKNSNVIKAGTIGWCYGGYLE